MTILVEPTLGSLIRSRARPSELLGFATWLRTTPGVFLVVAKGVMTCGETCCHFIANRQGSDTTNYLYELCLTPSALTLKLERR
jgi:hypothetical protein